MSEHSVVEARNQLSSLIDRALGGESVVITRHGNPVVELRAIRPPGRPITRQDIERMDFLRVTPGLKDNDSVSIVERMREQDGARLLRR